MSMAINRLSKFIFLFSIVLTPIASIKSMEKLAIDIAQLTLTVSKDLRSIRQLTIININEIEKVCKLYDDNNLESYEAFLLDGDSICAEKFKSGNLKDQIYCSRITSKGITIPLFPSYFVFLKEFFQKSQEVVDK